MTFLGTRTFDLEDQRAFARASGDFNPIHVDPIAARRSLAGEVVVHGAHTTLWALDRFFAHAPDARLATFTARFLQPVLLDRVVTAELGDDAAQIVVAQDGVACAAITLTRRDGLELANGYRSVAPPLGAPIERAFESLKALEREVPVAVDLEALRPRFPCALASLGERPVVAIAALSWLVGMECPGLHSLFSAMTLACAGERPTTTLRYRVVRADRRFVPARIDVTCLGLAASVEAFVRPPPIAQPSFDEVAAKVAKHEFVGARALVVGGSRGLGEVVAKIVSSGGGEAAITYRSGRAEADRIVDAAREKALRVDAVPFDVEDFARSMARLDELPPFTHLYYFATPRITRRKGVAYDWTLVRSFMTFYVEAFEALCSALKRKSASLAAFYPSTVFLDAPPRDDAEYCIAKGAGEALCRHLACHGGVRVLVHRLPRILTDQTATILPGKVAGVLDTLLPIVRELHARGGDEA